MNSKQPVISVRDIHFSYDKTREIIKGVTFDVYDNEYVCILGHNGSGKSTMSKILMGLLEPSSGEIRLLGEKVNKNNVRYLRDNIGIVFQNPDSQFIGLTVEDDIAFGLENRNFDPEKMKEIIINSAKRVEIENLLEYNCQQLSGGQKQRVAIASVLAIDSKIIIFDESTSMLDPKGKDELKKMIVNLRDNEGKTIISITHDMEEVLNADRVIILFDGTLIEDGKPKDIFGDKDKLKRLSLDFPFCLNLSSLLNEKHENISLCLEDWNLVEQLWKIKQS